MTYIMQFFWISFLFYKLILGCLLSNENCTCKINLIIEMTCTENRIEKFNILDLSNLKIQSNPFIQLSISNIKSLTDIQPLNANSPTISFINQLFISNGKIKTIKTGTFNNLSNMERLYLKSNQIEELQIESFKNMTILTYLDLSFNKIKEIKNKVFTILTSLKNTFFVRKSNNFNSVRVIYKLI